MNMEIFHKNIAAFEKISLDDVWDRLCYLFLVFLIGSFSGWIYEEIFYYFTEGMLRNRGILYGPWLPIYGIGAIGIYAMKSQKKHPVRLFLLCVGITGIVEYVIGYIGIYYLGLRLWDYRGLFLNYRGIICFRSVISFGILGLAFHYFLEPAAEREYDRIDKKVVRLVFLNIVVLFLVDCIVSYFFRTPITY